MPKRRASAAEVARLKAVGIDEKTLSTCANCALSTHAFVEVRTLSDEIYCLPVPLCLVCFDALQALKGTPAGKVGIVLCAERMEERTGIKWVFDDRDSLAQ